MVAVKVAVMGLVKVVMEDAIVVAAESAEIEALHDVVHVRLLLVVEISPLARTIAATGVGTETVNETETTMTADDPEPQTIETVIEIGMERMIETAATMIERLAPMEMIAKVWPISTWWTSAIGCKLTPVSAIDSPPPAHDELDTAE